VQVLQALQSPSRSTGSTAAQVVGAIGAMELPLQRWPGLLDALLNNVVNAPSDEMRIATLQVRKRPCRKPDAMLTHVSHKACNLTVERNV
jgi:hypothetical protein